MSDNLIYFKNTYEDSRQAFLDLARLSGGELKSHKISPDHSFESLYLPPAGKKERLLIITSGIHGIEGFTGSALQNYFMDKNYLGIKDEKTGILVIHGINPYGFKNKRRVTENNVDLNRNFDVTRELFLANNLGYEKVDNFLNPKEDYSRVTFLAKALFFILKHGMDNLRKAILRGQYQFPDGIFFGGKDFEPQVPLIQDEVSQRGVGYEKVLLIDLHTGYGQRGKLHLFGDRSRFLDPDYMNEVFNKLPIDYGQDKDFYAVTGGFTVFLAKLFYQKAKFAGVCFEFGTIDSHTTKGSLDSLYRMINEKTERPLFEEMFYPSDRSWRKSVIDQFDHTLKEAVKNWSQN